MRAYDFLTEDKTKLELPDMNVGDEVKVGRFKNRKAEIKGFKTDNHGQPVLKTTKGDQKLFKPRISKLEPSKIDETFDNSYKYEWEDQTKGAWRGHFTVKDNDEVNVNIEHWGEYWRIEFSRISNNNNPVPSHNMTGEGDSIRIFSTVITMLADFIDKIQPNIIKFSADKSETGSVSRAKLYSAIIKRFASAKGYNAQETMQDELTSYLLTRKEDKNASI